MAPNAPARRSKERTVEDAQGIADRCVTCWNERDGERDGIDGVTEAVQARFPDLRFALASRNVSHADRLRFSWRLGPEGGEAVLEATDFKQLAEDGQLRPLIGFLDRVPPGA